MWTILHYLQTSFLIVLGCITINFIQPLMLRAVEPTIINICFDEPLACGSQLYKLRCVDKNVIISTKFENIQLSQSLIYQIGASTELFINLDDMVDMVPGLKYTHMYTVGKHACVSFKFSNLELYVPSRGGHSSLTKWQVSLMLKLKAIFEACCFEVLPELLKIVDS